jgi:glycosyltransferase involved in cell wall biosynthesis
VIHNAADLDLIKAANLNYWDKKFGKDTEVWSCASSWRPHKRLNENIRYFLDFAPKDAIFAIAGVIGMEGPFIQIPNDKRIVLMGELDYMSLLSLYKRSSTFVHLAYLDHCPNVVVDAQAAGCKIICSSTGGTSEIANNGIVIQEETWNFKPIKLYEPPSMKWVTVEKKVEYEEKEKLSIVNCAKKYLNIMRSII